MGQFCYQQGIKTKVAELPVEVDSCGCIQKKDIQQFPDYLLCIFQYTEIPRSTDAGRIKPIFPAVEWIIGKMYPNRILEPILIPWNGGSLHPCLYCCRKFVQ